MYYFFQLYNCSCVILVIPEAFLLTQRYKLTTIALIFSCYSIYSPLGIWKRKRKKHRKVNWRKVMGSKSNQWMRSSWWILLE